MTNEMTNEMVNEILDAEQLDTVAGGFLFPNKFKDHQYAKFGITVKSHVWSKDEFIWRGKDIGHHDANAVMYFYHNNPGKDPKDLQEVLDYKKAHWFDYTSDCPGSCFTGESKISTPDGLKLIKDIKVGDEVITLNEQNEKIIGKVLEVRSPVPNKIFLVEFDNGTIWQTTETQWFYSGNNEFAPIFDGEGKEALDEDGKFSKIIKVTETEEIQEVYDFTVEGLNVFFVEGVAAEGYSVD